MMPKNYKISSVFKSIYRHAPVASMLMLFFAANTLASESKQFKQSPAVSGTAYSLSDFTPLYEEHYFPLSSALKGLDGDSKTAVRALRVVYREVSDQPVALSAQGVIFAIKDIDYRLSTVAPFYNFIDFRIAQIQRVVRKNSSNKISPVDNIDSKPIKFDVQSYKFTDQDFTSLSAPTDHRQYQLPFGQLSDSISQIKNDLKQIQSGEVQLENLVSDAGFDNFVQENWDQLLKDQRKLLFNFAVPSRGRAVSMSLRHIGPSNCDKKVLVDLPVFIKDNLNGSRCFKLEAKNWVIAQFLKPIYLVYNSSKQLVLFRGLSNIRSASDEQLRVAILYKYL